MNYGTLSFSDTGIVQSAQTSVNSYFQNVIQNTSNGASASSEFIAYNDQGTATTNYATVGINSSGYSGTGSINAAGYGYFLTASTDLVLGTIGANGIHFTTNSSATDALAISSAGAVSLPGGTANGVAYLNGSKVVTTGSALTFDGTNFVVGTSSPPYGISPRLTVQQSTDLSEWRGLAIASAGTDAYLGIYYYSSTGAFTIAPSYVSTAGYKPLAFNVNGSEQMRLTSTGLGIGTSSFSSRLAVSAAKATVQVTSTTGTNGAYQAFTNTGGNFYTGLDSSTGGDFAATYAGVMWHGGAYPLLFGTSNVERMRLDSSGNLGLGITPSSWGGGKTLDVLNYSSFAQRTAGNSDLSISWNAYIDSGTGQGTGYKYKITGDAASAYSQNGKHVWFTAPSGTAGNTITFTQALTLDASGVLLVGLTSATGVAKLQVSGALKTTGFTVSTLPAGTVGMRTYVTDALAPTFGATVVAGGAVTIPVFYNGSNWIVC